MKANKETSKLEKNLAILTEKCLEIDACSIILGEKYDDYHIFNKFKADFQRMAAQKDENNEPIVGIKEDSQSSSEEDRKTSSKVVRLIPVFKLISNRCVQLIESLVKQSKDDVESDGLSPLLEAIVKHEYKFCEKLFDMGLFDKPSDLRAQICRNSSVHLKESVLQLLIRNSQTDLILKVTHTDKRRQILLKST